MLTASQRSRYIRLITASRSSSPVEKVQKRATKLIINLQNMSYTDRLKRLNLPTLKYRRLRGDMIEVFKIAHDI